MQQTISASTGSGERLVKTTSTLSVCRIRQLCLDKPNDDDVCDTNSFGFHSKQGCWDTDVLIDYLFTFILIPVSCFVILFSVLFRLQLSVVRPNRSQVVRIELPCISVS